MTCAHRPYHDVPKDGVYLVVGWRNSGAKFLNRSQGSLPDRLENHVDHGIKEE